MSERRFFVDKNGIMGSNAILYDEERNHLVNVLRMRVGDEVILVCGNNLDYLCKISTIEKKSVALDVLEVVENCREPKIKVTLFQGVAKGEKMDLITQKITELGVYALVPFISEYTSFKDANVKVDRLNKITREAIKQCRRSNPIEISKEIKFSDMIEQLKSFDAVVFAYEKQEEISLKQVLSSFKNVKTLAIIVGSEGGFSEVEAKTLEEIGAVTVGLGTRILRAETAAISLSAIAMYELGEMQ